jgi:hypothetical protein
VIDCWLRRAGASKSELCELMADYGYVGYTLTLHRRHLKHRVGLRPIANADTEAPNVLWLPQDTVQRWLKRIEARGAVVLAGKDP